MNVLSYTTLNPYPCKESLNIVPGESCFSSSAIKKLSKLEEELNIKNIKVSDPVIIDSESLPSDGSKDSKMINRLASVLECGSEYCIIKKREVKNVLSDKEIQKEKERFKVYGPRNTNTGTDGEVHAYNVLLQWSDVFKFFYPLPHILISKDTGSENILSVKEIMDIVKKRYPKIRVIAADMSLEMKIGSICAWHAVVLLIDLREHNWTVEFFDSTGYPPNNYINKKMEDLKLELSIYKRYLKEKGIVETVVVTGRIKHQLTSSECGLHALIYIRRRLEGISYHLFSRFKIPDEFAKSFRRDIFVS